MAIRGIKETVLKKITNIVLALSLAGFIGVSPTNAATIKTVDRNNRLKKASEDKLHIKVKNKYQNKYGVNIFDINELATLDDKDLFLAICELGEDFKSLLKKERSSHRAKHSLELLKQDLMQSGLDLAHIMQERMNTVGFQSDVKCPDEKDDKKDDKKEVAFNLTF